MRFTLRDHLNGYPGGITKLAEDVGCHHSQIYRFCQGKTVRAPIRFVTAIAEHTADHDSLDGELMTRAWLLKRWSAQVEAMAR